MSAKKGNLLPNTGTLLPNGLHHHATEMNYAAMVASALHQQLGNTYGATKAVMRWTGASERTVKNWFAGTKGPSGDHLIVLVRYSDAVLDGFLQLAGRQQVVLGQELAQARNKVRDILSLLDELAPNSERPKNGKPE